MLLETDTAVEQVEVEFSPSSCTVAPQTPWLLAWGCTRPLSPEQGQLSHLSCLPPDTVSLLLAPGLHETPALQDTLALKGGADAEDLSGHLQEAPHPQDTLALQVAAARTQPSGQRDWFEWK